MRLMIRLRNTVGDERNKITITAISINRRHQRERICHVGNQVLSSLTSQNSDVDRLGIGVEPDIISSLF